MKGPGGTIIQKENFSKEYLEAAAENARYFIDAVRPKRTRFTYEVFMYCGLDSPEAYAELIRRVDRVMFGVHLDYTNLMRFPRKCFVGKKL